MFRFTNLTSVYEKDGAIIEYRVSVDNNTDNNSINANKNCVKQLNRED